MQRRKNRFQRSAPPGPVAVSAFDTQVGALELVEAFPRPIHECENVWIVMPDGCRLGARIWRPADAEDRPVPAILEYLPYRKRDGTAERDARTHPVYAGHGYACVRVDIRGNGESEGLMWDEYLRQEQDDALEVIAWIADQPWCDGNVGMMGISWGGFNALQVAARQPAALKAIITLCSTDDRYADDIHYKGGAMLGENLGWASTMFAYSSRPPDPLLVGDAWRRMWLDRLENTPLLIDNWLRHQRRDEFWKHGSVCEDFSAIKAAVFAVGGWGDAYKNAIPRMLSGLEAPTLGLTGPWVHKYPHLAVPGPAIDFLGESLRWWDHWLKGEPTGIMDEPRYRAYLMESVRPRTAYPHRDGRWVAESEWPSPCIEPQSWWLGPMGLGARPPSGERAHTVSSPQSTGGEGGEYCAMWLGPEWPGDQRRDDAGSLVFDTLPLAERTEILGAPVVRLELEVDRPRAFIAARLCDVWPDGDSTRVSFGILNLCHLDGHERPCDVEPGERYRVELRLDDVAYAFPREHRIRLALSTAYWPMIWPSPEPVRLTVYSGKSTLDLPVRPPRNERLRPLGSPRAARALEQTVIRPARHERVVERDLASGESTVRIVDDFGERVIDSIGLESGSVARESYRIEDDDPLSARAEIRWTQTLGRVAWRVRTETHTSLFSDRDHFYVRADLEAFEGERRVFTRSWDRKVPRDYL